MAGVPRGCVICWLRAPPCGAPRPHLSLAGRGGRRGSAQPFGVALEISGATAPIIPPHSCSDEVLKCRGWEVQRGQPRPGERGYWGPTLPARSAGCRWQGVGGWHGARAGQALGRRPMTADVWGATWTEDSLPGQARLVLSCPVGLAGSSGMLGSTTGRWGPPWNARPCPHCTGVQAPPQPGSLRKPDGDSILTLYPQGPPVLPGTSLR